MKTVFFGLIFFINNISCFAQTRQAIDSLHNELENAKDDTSRINAQIGLCLFYRLGNADSSFFYGEQALKSSRDLNYISGQIRALGFMSIVSEQQGNLSKSLDLGFKALQLAEDHHLEDLTGAALNGIAEAYLILKDYSRAKGFLRRYISIRSNKIIGKGVASVYIDQGASYTYFDLANAFEGLNQLDSAAFNIQIAADIFRKLGHDEPLIYQTMGNIAMKSGKKEEALSNYKKSLLVAIQNNEPRASAIAYNKIASFFKEENQPDSAIYYAVKGLDEARLIGQKKTILEAAALLSELYELKDTKVSLHYLKIANTYKDSLFGAGNIQAVQIIVGQQEERQKEKEADRIAYKNQLKQYALIAGLVVFLVVALILYRNNKQKQDANRVLGETLNDLKSTQSQLIQSEKMASLGELTAGIAHEIQNPLNFVNNFSDVNSELIDEANQEIDKGNLSEAKSILKNLKENQDKINHHGKRADAIVKGMLQHSRTSSGVKEPTDINALCDEYLRLAYHGLRAKDKSFNAEIKTDFDNTIGKVNIVPQEIGRVVLNLINNAFYAVNEKAKQNISRYEPTVVVKTSKNPPLGGRGAEIEIHVKDNGNGIPESIKEKIFQPFFTTKPSGEGTGLGLSLSYDIVKAHGGELKVETKEGEGSEFIILLRA